MMIESLLKQISSLYQESKLDKKRRTEQGEFFNIFNVVGLRSEEVRLHSAFIAELLNPKGSHGVGDLFLKEFLSIIDTPLDYININSLSQNEITERDIGRITDTEGGKIDIIIEDGNHAIIIENKIYAGDQKRQLMRYYNYGNKRFPNGFKLIYLTLDGHEASSYSLGNKEYEYLNISYEDEIIEWLDICSEIAEDKPLVQPVIKQYSELIKQLTYSDMDTNYKENLMSLILKPENINAVGEILKLQGDWEAEIIDRYIWKSLENYAYSKNMLFGKDIESGESGAWLYKEEWKYYALFIWTERKYDWNNMYIGVSWYEEPNRKNKICKKDYLKLECLRESPRDGWPYGWEYLPEGIRNWGYYITEEIVSGKVFNFIKNKFEDILIEIEQKERVMP
jgi:hypothetical protein